MPKHSSPERAPPEDLKPTDRDREFFTTFDETMEDFERRADKTLPREELPEHVETERRRAGQMTDRWMRELEQSAEPAVYDQWYRKYWAVHAEIVTWCESHTGHEKVTDVQRRLQDTDDALNALGKIHGQDRNYIQQAVKLLIASHDRIQAMLHELHETFPPVGSK
ncbi:MAG: hypothetical protein HYY50_05045 [Candidatus Kerfeldbacteria bacterium]|nr:hypothetical protein [Candidatus Kerfeldbacteria bacterium]